MEKYVELISDYRNESTIIRASDISKLKFDCYPMLSNATLTINDNAVFKIKCTREEEDNPDIKDIMMSQFKAMKTELENFVFGKNDHYKMTIDFCRTEEKITDDVARVRLTVTNSFEHPITYNENITLDNSYNTKVWTIDVKIDDNDNDDNIYDKAIAMLSKELGVDSDELNIVNSDIETLEGLTKLTFVKWNFD